MECKKKEVAYRWFVVSFIIVLVSVGVAASPVGGSRSPGWLLWMQVTIPYAVFIISLRAFEDNAFIAPITTALVMVFVASMSVFLNKHTFDSAQYIRKALFLTIPMMVSSGILFAIRSKIR